MDTDILHRILYMIKILDKLHENILICQLLTEYVFITYHMCNLMSITDLYDDTSLAGVCSLFTDYVSPAIEPIASAGACVSLLNAYMALLPPRNKRRCDEAMVRYRDTLHHISTSVVNDFILDNGKRNSFYDCRNYSLYALLHPAEAPKPTILYSENDDIIEGHIFVYEYDSSMELIGIQTDLYHNLIPTKLGFATAAFNYVIDVILPQKDILYIYAAAWRVISNILVNKYGFSTLTYDPDRELYELTDSEGISVRFGKKTKNFKHRALFNDFKTLAHERNVGLCDPSCYTLTLKIID